MPQIVVEKLNSKILHTQVTWVNSKKQKYEKNSTDTKMVRLATCFLWHPKAVSVIKSKFFKANNIAKLKEELDRIIVAIDLLLSFILLD